MNRLPENEKQDPSNPTLALAGVLMVASPSQKDELFERTVCLILEHSQEQSVGVVLNRPFSFDVAPLWNHLTQGFQTPTKPPAHLHFGGPLSGPVVAIHDKPALADAGNGTGVYLAAQVDNLKKLAMMPPERMRLLVGHVAWKSSDLESQIRDGDWYPLPAFPDLVFADDYVMWPEAMRRVGKMIVQTVANVAQMPSSPYLN